MSTPTVSVEDQATREEAYATDDESMFVDGEPSVVARGENHAGLPVASATNTTSTDVLPSQFMVPDDEGQADPDKEATSQRKRRRFWICLAVLMTLIAAAIGVATYFFFVHKETSTASAAFKSIHEGNDDGGDTELQKKNHAGDDESLGDGETMNVDRGNSPSPMPVTGDDGTSSEDDTSSTTMPDDPQEAPTAASVETSLPGPTLPPSPPPIATRTPTAQPSAGLSLRLKPVLLAVVPNAAALDDIATPQGAALDWLTSQSTLSLDTDNQIVQRYSVVVTALALQQPLDGFMDPSTSECDWEGVLCGNGNSTDMLDYGLDSTMNATATVNVTDSVLENVVVGIVWSNRSLTGTIPDDIGLLKSLQTLDLGENSIQGPIPGGVYQLVELEYLYLHRNQLSGSLSTEIGNLQKLNKLLLSDNMLTGTLPQQIGTGDSGITRPLSKLCLFSRLLYNFCCMY